MTSGQDNTKRKRLYPVICILITLAIGFPQLAFPDTKQYKNAIPVIDYIAKEQPLESSNGAIKPLQERGSLFRFTLSRQFLAALLSFLVLFLATYIYFKYIWRSYRLSNDHHKSHHKTPSHKSPKPVFKTAVSSTSSPPEPPIKEEGTVKGEKSPSEEESEGETFEFHNGETKITQQTDNMDQLKAERLEHARRIYHLMEKL
jgi:hypothetical protein